MIVRTKEQLLNALQGGERNIEIQGSYAEKCMRKYHKELATPYKELSPAIAIVGLPTAQTIYGNSLAGRLHLYKLVSYMNGKLVIVK